MVYICPYFSRKMDDIEYRNSNKYYVNESIILKEQKLSPQKFNIKYPYISNLDNDIIKSKINESIVNEVSDLFKSQVLIPEQVDFNEIFGTYEIGVNKNNILSVLFSLYTYVNRAAHGITQYSSITINTKTGEVYKFDELFNSKVYYTEFLNRIANQYIKENNIQLINPYGGVRPNQEYYLTEDNLIIYYQVYEYTPYYYGLFKIEIPYNEIKNLLSPTSPINKLL
jgi:hypothetical protein